MSSRAQWVVWIVLALTTLGVLAYFASSTPQPDSAFQSLGVDMGWALQWQGVDVDRAFQLRGVDVGHAWQSLPEAQVDRDLEEATALGANTVRVGVRWEWLQPGGPTSAPDRVRRLDRLLDLARSKGLRVVANLFGTPCWASTAPRLTNQACDPAYRLYPPANPADFGAFVSYVVSRWGGDIAAVEVWNEPNHSGFWRGSAVDYVDLVRESADAVNSSLRPNVPVVAGALSGSDTDYLRQLYAEDIDRWSDAISIHPYDLRWGGDGFGDSSRPRADKTWSFVGGVPTVHALMEAKGDSDPLWITEFGYAACPARPYCVAPDDQARYLTSALRLAADWSYVDAFLIYRLRDWDGGSFDWQHHFGLLQQDWSPRPAANAVKTGFSILGREGVPR